MKVRRFAIVTAVTAAIAACIGLVPGIATANPANKPPVIAFGQLCLHDKDGHLHCVNNEHGREHSGNTIQVYASDHIENNWESVKVGVVSIHPYFPWTGDEGKILDNAEKGRPVVELEYLGGGRMGTNFCITQLGYDVHTAHGGVILHECVTSHPKIQLWVHVPEIGWFAVWSTQQGFNNHSFAQLLGAPELNNGEHFITLQAGTGFTGWNWVPRGTKS